MPFVRRTRATLRSAEFGFFGVWVNTRTHTPRFCGLSCSAGLLVLVMTFARPFRTSWLIVGTVEALQSRRRKAPADKHAATPRAKKRENAPDSALRAASRLRRRSPERSPKTLGAKADWLLQA